MMKIRIILLLMGFLSISLAQAVPVQGLYSAQITLPSQTSEQRLLQQAFQAAAKQVLTKVSGRSQDISGQVLSQASQQAASWVAQHSIIDLSDLLQQGDELVPGKQVNVTFYRSSIDGFLTANGLPIWGEDRPSVLVWLVVEDESGRNLYGANQPSERLNQLAQTVTSYGVPIYAPLLDRVDKAAISSADIWGGFEETIAAASRRYQTDAVLTVRLTDYQANKGLSQTLFLADQSQTERYQGEQLEPLITQLAIGIAEALSNRYASVKNADFTNQVKIRVAGINAFGELDKIQSYFTSMTLVQQAQLTAVMDEQADFLLTINGQKEKLMNTIALNATLIPALEPSFPAEMEQAKSSADYEYFEFNSEE
ncbi:DUF2066 domain-containing protein [Marinomonas epiphytica]